MVEIVSKELGQSFRLAIPLSLVDFIKDTADLTDEELGQSFRLAVKKVQYERGEVHCENESGKIEHENQRVKCAASQIKYYLK